MKRTPSDFEGDEAQGLAALERRKEAEREIVLASRALERTPTGPARVALWEPLMQAVRKYNQAEAAFRAAQQALDTRAATRRLEGE